MPTEQIKQEQNKESAETLAWIIYNGAALMGVAVNDPKKSRLSMRLFQVCLIRLINKNGG